MVVRKTRMKPNHLLVYVAKFDQGVSILAVVCLPKWHATNSAYCTQGIVPCD